MKKTFTKKILSASIISLMTLQMFYFLIEPTVSIAATAVDTGGMLVTLNVTQQISITSPIDVVMTPNIGITADRSIGTTAWTVTTNSTTGYKLEVIASAAPAMVRTLGGDNFADYTEGTPGTPDLWGGVASGAKEFGFSAYGTNVVTGTWGTSTAGCGVAGAPDVTLKYRGFAGSGTPISIATKSGVTAFTGDTSNICFAAQQNAVYAQSGAYTATITATATTL